MDREGGCSAGGLPHGEAWRDDADSSHDRTFRGGTSACDEEIVHFQRQKSPVRNIERLIGIPGDIIHEAFLMDIHAVGAAEYRIRIPHGILGILGSDGIDALDPAGFSDA